jgi:hypothetical protein
MTQFQGSVFVRRVRAGVGAGSGMMALGLALAACATSPDSVSRKEDRLTAAGFQVRQADTQARRAMLASLPANQFVQRVRADAVNYVYADPLVCGCLYVGSQASYEAYRRAMLEAHMADEHATSTQIYANDGWNWDAWTTDGFGFGHERGW